MRLLKIRAALLGWDLNDKDLRDNDFGEFLVFSTV